MGNEKQVELGWMKKERVLLTGKSPRPSIYTTQPMRESASSSAIAHGNHSEILQVAIEVASLAREKQKSVGGTQGT